MRDILARLVVTQRRPEHDKVPPQAKSPQDHGNKYDIPVQIAIAKPIQAHVGILVVPAFEEVAIDGQDPARAVVGINVPDTPLERAREDKAGHHSPIAPFDELVSPSACPKALSPMEVHIDASEGSAVARKVRFEVYEKTIPCQTTPLTQGGNAEAPTKPQARSVHHSATLAGLLPPERLSDLPAIPEQTLITRDSANTEHVAEAVAGPSVSGFMVTHVKTPQTPSSQGNAFTAKPIPSFPAVSENSTALKAKKRHVRIASIWRALLKVDRLHETWLKTKRCRVTKRFPVVPNVSDTDGLMGLESTGLAPRICLNKNNELENMPDAGPLPSTPYPSKIVQQTPSVLPGFPIQGSFAENGALPAFDGMSRQPDVQISGPEKRKRPQEDDLLKECSGQSDMQTSLSRDRKRVQYHAPGGSTFLLYSNLLKRKRAQEDVGIQRPVPKTEEDLRPVRPLAVGALNGVTADEAAASMLKALKTSNINVSAALGEGTGNVMWRSTLQTTLEAIRDYAKYPRNSMAAKGWRWPPGKIDHNAAIKSSVLADDLRSNLVRYNAHTKVTSKEIVGYQAACEIISEGSKPPPEMVPAPAQTTDSLMETGLIFAPAPTNNPLMALGKESASACIINWLEVISQLLDDEIHGDTHQHILNHFSHIAQYAGYKWQDTKVQWPDGKMTAAAASRCSMLAGDIRSKLREYMRTAADRYKYWIMVCMKHARLINEAIPGPALHTAPPTIVQEAASAPVTSMVPFPSSVQAAPAASVQTTPLAPVPSTTQNAPPPTAPAFPPTFPTTQSQAMLSLASMTVAQISSTYSIDSKTMPPLKSILSSNSSALQKSAAILWWFEFHLDTIQKKGNGGILVNLVAKFLASVLREVVNWAITNGSWNEQKTELCIARRVVAMTHAICTLPNVASSVQIMKVFGPWNDQLRAAVI